MTGIVLGVLFLVHAQLTWVNWHGYADRLFRWQRVLSRKNRYDIGSGTWQYREGGLTEWIGSRRFRVLGAGGSALVGALLIIIGAAGL